MAVILLVEDTRDNRDIYRVIMEFGGHMVIEATDGREGVRLAHEMQPDIIVMDITMPVMDGLEATRILKADPETRGIPIVILSAHAMPEDQELAVQAGADAYLSKPCEPRRVLLEVERFLG